MMEICDWTSETVSSSSAKLEVCEWSDESNSSLLLRPTTTRKRHFSEIDQSSCVNEIDDNGWEEVEWSTSCSIHTINTFSAPASSPPFSLLKVSTPAADSAETVLPVVSSISSSPKPPSETRCQTPIRSMQNVDQEASTSFVSVRRSPRLLKYRKTPVDGRLLSNSFTEDKWQLFSVLKLNGCAESCATDVHGLSEFDILQAHARFCSKSSNHDKRQWLFDYCATHCPLNNFGEKDPSKMSFVISGREVCQSLWLATLSVSSSRFYEIRKEFMNGEQSQSYTN